MTDRTPTTTLQVELIHDADCPNVEPAREVLRQALAQVGLAGATWREWRRDDPAAPAHVRAYGSPTVLVGGRDVAPTAAHEPAACCRLYPSADGRLRGVPPLAAVLAAIQGAGV